MSPCCNCFSSTSFPQQIDNPTKTNHFNHTFSLITRDDSCVYHFSSDSGRYSYRYSNQFSSFGVVDLLFLRLLPRYIVINSDEPTSSNYRQSKIFEGSGWLYMTRWLIQGLEKIQTRFWRSVVVRNLIFETSKVISGLTYLIFRQFRCNFCAYNKRFAD